MKKFLLSCTFIILTITLFGVISGCDNQSVPLNPQNQENSLSGFLENYFKQKYSNAITYSDMSKFFINTNVEESSMEEINRLRGVYENAGEKDTNPNIGYNIYTAFRINGNQVDAFVSPMYVSANRDGLSAGTDYYHLDVVFIDGKFKIKNEIQDYVKFKFELTDQESDEYNSLNDFMYSKYNRTNPSLEYKNALKTQAIPASVTFAKTYYSNVKDLVKAGTYTDYSYLANGGDCTNFISHAMKKYGWAMEDYWFYKKDSATSGSDMKTYGRSTSWAGAKDFNSYMEGIGNYTKGSGAKRVTNLFRFALIPNYNNTKPNATELANRLALEALMKNLQLGDIIQLSDSKSNSTVHHSAIVTYKSANDIGLTYRNGGGGSPQVDWSFKKFTPNQYISGYRVR